MKIPNATTVRRVLAALGPLNLALVAGPVFTNTSSEYVGSAAATAIDRVLSKASLSFAGPIVLVFMTSCAALAGASLVISIVQVVMHKTTFRRFAGEVPALAASMLAPYMAFYVSLSSSQYAYAYTFSMGWFLTATLWTLSAILGPPRENPKT